MSRFLNKLIIFASRSDILDQAIQNNKNNTEFETVVEYNYYTHNPINLCESFKWLKNSVNLSVKNYMKLGIAILK
jgi:hypothetical protein